MKKLLALFCVVWVLFSLCGCKEKQITENDNSSSIKIVLPTDDTVNGYRQDNISSISESTDSADALETGNYYVNTKTKKFHKASCYYAKTGSVNGEWSKDNRNALISDGYSPCSKCSP